MWILWNDQEVGVTHYYYIRQKYLDNNKIDDLKFIYMKYWMHSQYDLEYPGSIEEIQLM